MKPTITYRSHGPEGNVFWLLSAAGQALRKQRRINDYNTMRDRVTSSHSYQEALDIMSEYVTLNDLDK